MANLPKVEVCEECFLILACVGSEEPANMCNHGYEAVGSARLCSRNPAGCAVSGNTVYVSPEKYPHVCQPLGQALERSG